MSHHDLTALAFEYQADYRPALGNLDISDLMNNPSANGECRVFGLGFKEKSAYGIRLDAGAFGDDISVARPCAEFRLSFLD